jgi:hypothetical protein
MLAVRGNKDLQCKCSGPVTAIFGTALYYESAEDAVAGPMFPKIPSRKIAVDAKGILCTNSPKFSMTPGAAFTVEVLYAARIENERAAYLAVLFFDDTGREVGRWFLYIASSKATNDAAKTAQTAQSHSTLGERSWRRGRWSFGRFPGRCTTLRGCRPVNPA